MKGNKLAEFLLQEDQPMIFAKITPVNRQQKKRFQKEYVAVAKHLQNTEANFLNQLFNEADNNSYEALYTFYHDQYLNNVRVAKRLVNMNTIEINETYFSDTYRSVV